jgi:hypothetical protein
MTGTAICRVYILPHWYFIFLLIIASKVRMGNKIVPDVDNAMKLSMTAPFVFIGSFYVFLIGSKMLLAVLFSRSKSFLNGNLYKYTMRFLCLALCIFALLLLRDSLKLLRIINF